MGHRTNVAEDLERWVMENFEPGATLPSEKELAQNYQVSRLTIREAMKQLAGRGLIDTAQGRRAQVARVQNSPLAPFLAITASRDPNSLLELIQVRMGLEVQSATLAATHANRAAIAAIENALEEMRTAAHSAKNDELDSRVIAARYNQADVQFHEALALASGNRILSSLLESIEVPLRRLFDISITNQVVDGHLSLLDNVNAHAEILDFVRQGDARKAAAAMRSHLKRSERDVRNALIERLPTIDVFSE